MTETPLHDMLVRGHELAVLENLFRDDCQCESRAEFHRPNECTVEVVARCYQACEPIARNWCQARLTRFHSGPYRHCSSCALPSMTCWTIIPV